MTKKPIIALLLIVLAHAAIAPQALADINARRAIAIGQRAFDGAEAFKVEYENDRDIYEVSLVQPSQGRLIYLKLRARDGAIINTNFRARADEVSEAIMAIDRARLNLRRAIRIALRRVSGFVEEADLEVRDDSRNGAWFDVDIRSGLIVWEIRVDSRTGEIIKVSRERNGNDD